MARKQKNIHYIYKTTCSVTGRWYIGMHSTNNLEDGYMGSGLRLRRSIRKYGIENHIKEILEFLPSREDLILREQEIVNKELISDEKCMNLKEGGTGGFVNEEHRGKLISAGIDYMRSLRKNEIRYQRHCLTFEENKKKGLLEGKGVNIINHYDWNGKNHSEETKRKMSETSKGMGVGETNSQYGTCWINKNNIDKKIKKDDLETYLKDGWLKGRTKKDLLFNKN